MTMDTWPALTLATLHDVGRCLAFVAADDLSCPQTGELQRADRRRLHSYLTANRPPGQDADPFVDQREAWLFRSLTAGGLIGSVNGRFRLARAAHDWLAAPPGAQIAALRQFWLTSPQVAYAWLPAAAARLKHGNAWDAVSHQVATSVMALPVDTWTPLADLLADLAAQAAALTFGVAHNFPSVRQATARQAHLLASFLLGEVLPRLAIISLAETPAGQHLALTAEGASWLRRAWQAGATAVEPEMGGAPDAPAPACWQVTDDLRLIIPLAAPAAAAFEALQFADLLTVGPPAEYRLTRASLERGLSRGYELADIRFLLAHGAGHPLSGAASAQLARWEEELTVIRYEPGYRLRPLAATLLPRLREREPFRAATELAASGRWAFVRHGESAALLRYLRRSGYVLSPETAGVESAAAPLLPAFLLRRLPLIPLATLAGLYGRLRAHVPGLADLGLADLEQTLLAALPPVGQAAVARLAASNAALIAQRLSAADSDPEALPSPAAGPAEPVAPRGPDPNKIMALIQAALAAGAPLDILYADTAGAVTQRRIRPLRLEERWGRQYVVAYCELRRDERAFRLDRIVAVEGW